MNLQQTTKFKYFLGARLDPSTQEIFFIHTAQTIETPLTPPNSSPSPAFSHINLEDDSHYSQPLSPDKTQTFFSSSGESPTKTITHETKTSSQTHIPSFHASIRDPSPLHFTNHPWLATSLSSMSTQRHYATDDGNSFPVAASPHLTRSPSQTAAPPMSPSHNSSRKQEALNYHKEKSQINFFTIGFFSRLQVC